MGSFRSLPQRARRRSAELCGHLLTRQCHQQRHPSTLPAVQSRTSTPAVLVLRRYCAVADPGLQADLKVHSCLSPKPFPGLGCLSLQQHLSLQGLSFLVPLGYQSVLTITFKGMQGWFSPCDHPGQVFSLAFFALVSTFLQRRSAQ